MHFLPLGEVFSAFFIVTPLCRSPNKKATKVSSLPLWLKDFLIFRALSIIPHYWALSNNLLLILLCPLPSVLCRPSSVVCPLSSVFCRLSSDFRLLPSDFRRPFSVPPEAGKPPSSVLTSYIPPRVLRKARGNGLPASIPSLILPTPAVGPPHPAASATPATTSQLPISCWFRWYRSMTRLAISRSVRSSALTYPSIENNPGTCVSSKRTGIMSDDFLFLIKSRIARHSSPHYSFFSYSAHRKTTINSELL